MITADIIDQGTIDTTLPSTSDPMYQVSALALFYRQQFAALKTAGFQFKRPEISDLSSYNTSINSWLDDANDRFDDWLQGNVASAIGNIPDAITVGEAMVTGGAGAVVAVLVEKLIQHQFHVEDSHAEYEGAQDLSVLTDKLDEVVTAIHTIMNEYTINIHSTKEDLTFKGGRNFDL
jgi:hypothetical protein